MKLLVIGQVDIVGEDSKSTRNRSLNIILNEYAKHCDEVAYFAPGKIEQKSVDTVRALFYSASPYKRNLLGRIKLIVSSKILREAEKVVEEFNPDIIQIRVPAPFAIKIGLHLKKRFSDRIMVYVAGDISESLRANFAMPGIGIMSDVMLQWQDRLIRGLPVVTAGDVLKQKLMDRYNGQINCHAYYSTTHTDIYRGEERDDELLVVGRLEPLKRPHLAVDVLSILHKKGLPNYVLRFLGDGPERENLAARAASLGLADKVIFHGYERDSMALRSIYLKAKFLLHPSKTEGTSKVLAEAMAHGVVPIAVRDVGSNNYILAHEVGFLTNGDPAEMAKCILESQANEEIYRRKLEAGYVYAERHTLSVEVENMMRWAMKELGA